MISTSDTNFAAYLVMLEHPFQTSVDDSTGKRRVLYAFDLTPETYADLFTSFVHADLQRFIDAQRRLKHVLRTVLQLTGPDTRA